MYIIIVCSMCVIQAAEYGRKAVSASASVENDEFSHNCVDEFSQHCVEFLKICENISTSVD